MEPRIQYAKTEDGVSIAYYTLGDGPALVRMPDIPWSHIQLAWQRIPDDRRTAEVAAERFTYVRYDNRGAGSSTRDVTDFSMEAYLQDLEAVVDRLSLERFALAGGFDSGPLAIAYAVRNPQRVSHLILQNTYARRSDLSATPEMQAFEALRDKDWTIFTETVAQVNTGWSGEPAREIAAFYREAASHEVIVAAYKEIDKFDITDILSEVQTPALVLHGGSRSPVALSRALAAHIPDARLVVGGWSELLAAMGEFLDEDEETPAPEQQVEPPAPVAPPAVVRRRATPTEPRVHYAKTEDGVSIAYWRLGEGEPIVWPPMAPVSSFDAALKSAPARRWFDLLAQRGTLVAYDSRGGGLSGGNLSDVTLATNALDLEAVVDHLGIDRFTLWGGGFAGPAAITYAATHPDKVSHLALWCTFARASDAFSPSQIKPFMDLMESDWELFIDTWLRALSGWSPGEEQHDLVAKLTEDLTPESVRTLMDTLFETDVTALLTNVESPTLVMHRRQIQMDVKVARSLASGIPNASLALLEGDSLSPQIGDVEGVIATFDEFLGDVAPEEYESASAPSEDATQTRISPPPETKTFASGRYVVVRLLGQGAQKSVFLVNDTLLGRQCALSMLNPALLDPGDIDRLRREAQTMAQFGTQPNIVTVYDQGEEDGAPFIVCEYVPGGELRDELAAAAGPLPLERALAVGIDICRALSFAHGRDVVHRDLKPENIWLTEERNAKLGDFGIALTMGRTRLTMPGGATGTALYMAPEQVSGGDVDARSDLYAFGVLLYELVAGRPPFIGDDPNAIMYQHVNAEPESPAKHNASVPPGLERLIMRLLAKAKTERPGSAEEVLSELEQAATELAGGQHAPSVVRTTGADPIEQEIRFCTSADGTRIAYATYGEPAARALVVVQNFEDIQEFWWKQPRTRTLYEGLASGRRLVTFDRRGVGGSQRDVDDLAIPAQVADVAAVVDQLGLKSFDLLAWATGGALAATYAVEHPERIGRLVLWTPMMRTSDSVPRVLQDMPQSIRANWSLARRSWAALTYPNGPLDTQRWFSNMLRDSVAPEVAARHIEANLQFDTSAILRSVKAPTFVLANSDSETAFIQGVASLIPDARFVTLEGATFTLGVFKSLFTALRNFLDEADAEPEAVESPSATGDFATTRSTEVESSTARGQSLGDENAREVRPVYAEIVHAALQAHDGTEMGHSGDDITASFPTASSALDCAIAIQLGVAAHRHEHPDAPLAVYIRLNAGEPVAEDGPNGLLRTSVDLEVGLVDDAQPEQIVASDVVRQLAAGTDYLFSDVGETKLPGFEDAVQLWELKWRGF